MADLEDVKAIDRLVRALFENTAARKVALEAMSLEANPSTRAEVLVARLAKAEAGLPTLSHGNAVALVQAFDEIRARNPTVIAALGQDELPALDPMYSGLALIS